MDLLAASCLFDILVSTTEYGLSKQQLTLIGTLMYAYLYSFYLVGKRELAHAKGIMLSGVIAIDVFYRIEWFDLHTPLHAVLGVFFGGE